MYYVTRAELPILIASTAHEVNRVWCEFNGDDSPPHWDDAPQWQRDSVISGVKHLMANPDATPEHSHENWLRDKEADGWVYGEAKDPKAKTHPCMVPYDKLPPEQRAKDSFFHATVRNMLKRVK